MILFLKKYLFSFLLELLFEEEQKIILLKSRKKIFEEELLVIQNMQNNELKQAKSFLSQNLTEISMAKNVSENLLMIRSFEKKKVFFFLKIC